VITKLSGVPSLQQLDQTAPTLSATHAATRSGMRMSAGERRTSVVAAAVHEFAQKGYAGTSTEAIAASAGISQPYLFRLFPTKRDLFLATVHEAFDRVEATFARAGAGLAGEEALAAMGIAYGALIADRDLLLLQLHAYAASSEPEVARLTRERYASLARFVTERTGVDGESLRSFFAIGMLCNVVVALGLHDVAELWGLTECIPARGPGTGPTSP
jgi:AcrR family transcriptional regulator